MRGQQRVMGSERRTAIVTRRICAVAVALCASESGPIVVSGFGVAASPYWGRTLVAGAADGGKTSRTRGVRRPRSPSLPELFVLPATARKHQFVGEAPLSTKDWLDLDSEEEQTLCELIVENRRLQDLQVTLEQKERRPVTVHEWAVAAGHPSAHQLMEALQQGRRAERTMLLCHQGLVRSVAFRYNQISRTLSLEDLTQEGNVGLLQAVERFDPTKQTRFSSYAVFRIKASILRAIANKDRLVRVPVHAQDTAMRILAASHALQVETGTVPTDAQLALALSIPEERVTLYRSAARPNNVEDVDNPALSTAVSGREGRKRGEQWPWGVLEVAQVQGARQDMLRAMHACLSPTEERVLRLRFGMEEATGKGQGQAGRAGALTFKEIGRTMELSAEGIRKMVFRSIAKLQESDEANGLLLAYADMV